MKVTPIKTHKITTADTDLFTVLDQYVTELPEKSVLAVTSKIVSICEGSVVPTSEISKGDLTIRESEYYIPSEKSKYGIFLAVKDSLMAPSAGIDESNGNGYYILWPKNAYVTASKVRAYLQKKFGIKDLGVIITDSTVSMLRWGTVGVSIGYSGIAPLKNYIGATDLFDYNLRVTKSSIVNGLAAAAVVTMGEGDESTPLALLSELSFVQFLEKDPTPEEIESLKIALDEDLYEPFLTAVKWEKGGSLL